MKQEVVIIYLRTYRMDSAGDFTMNIVQFLETRFLYHIIIFTFVAIIYRKWFWEKDGSFDGAGRAVPGMKVPFLNLYGNLNCLPSFNVIRKSGFPLVTFLADIVVGQAQLFKEQGIFRLRLPFQQYVLLIKPETVEALLSSSVLLEKAQQYSMLHPWLGTGLLTSHGSKWRSRRKLLAQSFHLDILKEFVPILNEQAKILVSILKSKVHEEWIDIRNPITLCSLDIICETTLGVHVGAQTDSGLEYVPTVLRAMEAIMERVYNPCFQFDIIFQLSSVGRQFKKDVDSLRRFAKMIIHKKKSAMKQELTSQEENGGSNPTSKRKALMDVLLDIHMNQPDFTEDDIQEEIDTFVFAGHDTTAIGMHWALYLIGLYPEIQDKIQTELDHIFGDDRNTPVTVDDLNEMHYLECVLKESHRLYPSVPFYGRNIRESTNLCGYHIKKGSYVYAIPFILHRNADVFPNPEKFVPERFLPENCLNRSPFAYVPFSAGPRKCIGQRFAIMEEKTVFSSILRNFRVKSLEHRDIVLPAPELALHSSGPMKVKFIPR